MLYYRQAEWAVQDKFTVCELASAPGSTTLTQWSSSSDADGLTALRLRVEGLAGPWLLELSAPSSKELELGKVGNLSRG